MYYLFYIEYIELNYQILKIIFYIDNDEVILSVFNWITFIFISELDKVSSLCFSSIFILASTIAN